MAWIWLAAAGVCEILWAIGLKVFGLRFTIGGAGTVLVMLLSFLCLERAMRALPLGTSYAIWTGMGAVGTAVWGMAMLGESRAWPRLLCIGLIVAGIAGLKLMDAPAR